jgi:hypothetical protein
MNNEQQINTILNTLVLLSSITSQIENDDLHSTVYLAQLSVEHIINNNYTTSLTHRHTHSNPLDEALHQLNIAQSSFSNF